MLPFSVHLFLQTGNHRGHKKWARLAIWMARQSNTTSASLSILLFRPLFSPLNFSLPSLFLCSTFLFSPSLNPFSLSLCPSQSHRSVLILFSHISGNTHTHTHTHSLSLSLSLSLYLSIYLSISVPHSYNSFLFFLCLLSNLSLSLSLSLSLTFILSIFLPLFFS